jgi:MoxR-like ATPase
MLPCAKVAFLDEIMDAPEPLLRSMLEILNERTYSHPPQMLDCPLHMVICTTNFVTETPKMKAVLDRILFKSHVSYIREPLNRQDFYYLAAHGTIRQRDKNNAIDHDKPPVRVQIERGAYKFDLTSRFEFGTLLELHNYLRTQVTVPDEVLEAYDKLQSEVHTQLKLPTPFSDRRLGKLVGCIKAGALLDGRNVACLTDLDQLKNGLIDSGIEEQQDVFMCVYEKLVLNTIRSEEVNKVVAKYEDALFNLRGTTLPAKLMLKRILTLEVDFDSAVGKLEGAPTEETQKRIREVKDAFASAANDLKVFGGNAPSTNRALPQSLR